MSTLSCNEILDSLAAYTDGQVSLDERVEIKSHILQCEACSQAYTEQNEMKKAMVRLRIKTNKPNPPVRILHEARRAWNIQDGSVLKRYRVQFALASAVASFSVFGGAWAYLERNQDFPTSQVITNFRANMTTGASCEYSTHNADTAAQWLSKRLDTRVPPVELSLSGGKLVGANINYLHHLKVGSLVFSTNSGNVVLYISFDHTKFNNMLHVTEDGNDFMEPQHEPGIQFYGWNSHRIGYALISQQSSNQDYALDAERQTLLP